MFRVRDSYALWSGIPAVFHYTAQCLFGFNHRLYPTTPDPKARFGLIPFRSPLLREYEHLLYVSF